MIEKKTRDLNEMWDAFEYTDLFLTTSNSTLTSTGNQLIMGAGHAKQVATKFVGIDSKLGQAIIYQVDVMHKAGAYETKMPYVLSGNGMFKCYNPYGLIVSERWPKGKIGLFQTKDWFSHDSSIELIEFSTKMLRHWCERNPKSRVDMPFAGIGKGRLDIDTVRPILETLPDTVYVWRHY